MVCCVAVLGDGVIGQNVHACLRALDHLLGNLDGHFDCGAANDPTLDSLLRQLKQLGFGCFTCRRFGGAHTEQALDDTPAQNEGGTCCLNAGLAGSGQQCFARLDIDRAPLFDVFRGLAFDVATKELREEVRARTYHTACNRAFWAELSASKRACFGAAGDTCEVRTLACNGFGEIGDYAARCAEQSIFFIGTLDAIPRYAFTRFFGDLFAALDAPQCSFFWGAGYGFQRGLSAGQYLLATAYEFAAEGGLPYGLARFWSLRQHGCNHLLFRSTRRALNVVRTSVGGFDAVDRHGGYSLC